MCLTHWSCREQHMNLAHPHHHCILCLGWPSLFATRHKRPFALRGGVRSSWAPQLASTLLRKLLQVHGRGQLAPAGCVFRG